MLGPKAMLVVYERRPNASNTVAGGGDHPRSGSHRITRHARAVDVVGHDQGAERRRLVFALAELQARHFAVEVGGLDLGAGQVAFVEVVIGQQVDALQTQALFDAAAVGVGFHAHRGHAKGMRRIP